MSVPPGLKVFRIRIPAGMRSKQKLFAVLADKLHLPSYFGRNWDALEECLKDLSWLPPGDILLQHGDMPFGPGGENRDIYLAILRDVTAHWEQSGQRRFRAELPPRV